MGDKDCSMFPWFVALTLNPTQPTLIPWYLILSLGFLGYHTGNIDMEFVGDTQSVCATSGLRNCAAEMAVLGALLMYCLISAMFISVDVLITYTFYLRISYI